MGTDARDDEIDRQLSALSKERFSHPSGTASPCLWRPAPTYTRGINAGGYSPNRDSVKTEVWLRAAFAQGGSGKRG